MFMFCGKKILIIDGNANYLYALEAKLVVSGAEVLTHTGTGKLIEITKILQTEKVDSVILELDLPDFDGQKVLYEMRNEPRTSSLPVFIYTFTDDEKKRKALDILGAPYYFNKGEIGQDEFIGKIHKILINKEKLKNLKSKN